MAEKTIALFGEAEKGQFRAAHYCRSLPQLVEYFGNPPKDSLGLYFAVQALLFRRDLIFFRVEEEGFSEEDYFSGFRLLHQQNLIPEIIAYCLPGVGDSSIMDTLIPICDHHKSILITTESDLYDYLAISPLQRKD